MASVQDWVELARSTVRALEGRQVTGLYGNEWPDLKRRLVSEHSHSIDSETSASTRFVRTCSALLFGLTKRLAPQRRLVFALALASLLYAFIALFTADHIGELTLMTYGALGASFLLITLLLGMELIDKIKFRDELELARELQSELIPKDLPSIEGLEIAAFHRIANTVGGDIYDFIPLPDGRIAVLFGDASGHGMAAGLIMAVAHASFHTQLEVDPAPVAMFATLNRILCRTGTNRSFFSGAYLLLGKEGEFEGILAGHPPLLQFAPDGSMKRTIGEGSYPLGIKRNYEWGTISGVLDEGDVLILHSDGLIESRDEHGIEFGDDRVLMMSRWSAGRTATDILAALIAHWQSFCGHSPIDDDVTLAVLRRTRLSSSATAIPSQDDQTEDGVDEKESVRHDEYPVVNEHTVGREAY